MIDYFCAGVAVFSALLAAFISDVRAAVLWLWVAGLAVGGVFLAMNAEVLAVIQWVVSTLVALAFIYYAVMLGEYGIEDGRSSRARMIQCLVPVAMGLSFVGMLAFGAGSKFFSSIQETGVLPLQNAEGVGRRLTGEYLLAVELLGLTLFLSIVGSGVLGRPDVREE